jgi:hypothetical protein
MITIILLILHDRILIFRHIAQQSSCRAPMSLVRQLSSKMKLGLKAKAFATTLL